MMILGDLVFLVILLMTLSGALIAVLSKSLIYSLLGLVQTMFGIAGIYVFLNAPFIAMMQILIYVGAISILIAFAIMMAGPFSKRPKEWTTPAKFAAGAVTALASFFLTAGVLCRTVWTDGPVQPFTMTTKEIGQLFFDKMTFPFELISFLIIISIIGGVMLALMSRGEK